MLDKSGEKCDDVGGSAESRERRENTVVRFYDKKGTVIPSFDCQYHLQCGCSTMPYERYGVVRCMGCDRIDETEE
jgi:hypothetical protein